MTYAAADLRVGFIGAGQMATALAKGFIAAATVPPQAIVACVILFSFALHLTVWWMPQQPHDIGWGILIRSGAILSAAALGVIAIWWIADGVNRMALALADEVSEETPTTL